MLREINHKNIVGLKDIIIEDNKLYLVFEFLNFDLRKYLEILKPDE